MGMAPEGRILGSILIGGAPWAHDIFVAHVPLLNFWTEQPLL